MRTPEKLISSLLQAARFQSMADHARSARECEAAQALANMYRIEAERLAKDVAGRSARVLRALNGDLSDYERRAKDPHSSKKRGGGV